MPYVLITPHRSFIAVEKVDLPKDDHEFLLKCYELLQCDTIDVVPCFRPDWRLIIDDNAKLFEGWENNVNVLATLLYCDPLVDVIVGRVIVARLQGCDLVPLTERDFELIDDLAKQLIADT